MGTKMNRQFGRERKKNRKIAEKLRLRSVGIPFVGGTRFLSLRGQGWQDRSLVWMPTEAEPAGAPIGGKTRSVRLPASAGTVR